MLVSNNQEDPMFILGGAWHNELTSGSCLKIGLDNPRAVYYDSRDTGFRGVSRHIRECMND